MKVGTRCGTCFCTYFFKLQWLSMRMYFRLVVYPLPAYRAMGSFNPTYSVTIMNNFIIKYFAISNLREYIMNNKQTDLPLVILLQITNHIMDEDRQFTFKDNFNPFIISILHQVQKNVKHFSCGTKIHFNYISC